MRNAKPLLLTALILPPLLALAAPDEGLGFGPEAGSSATKTFTTEVDMSLDNMSININGQPAPVDMSDVEMNIHEERTTVVTDEYVTVEGGRPTKLRRSFDELGSLTDFAMVIPMMGGEEERSIEANSDLEGKTVVFTWDAEADEFDIAFDEDDGDEELLEGLWEDMDLRVLLPASAVAEGDTWELDTEGLKNLLAPGGKLSLVPEESEGSDMMPGFGSQGMSDAADFLGEMDGSANGEFIGMREEGGVRVAVVKVTLDISGANDLSEIVREGMDEMEVDMPMEVEIGHMDAEMEIEAEGTLLWDLSAGRLHSFEMSGTQNILMDMGMAMDMGEQSMEIEQSFEMSGNYSMTVSAE